MSISNKTYVDAERFQLRGRDTVLSITDSHGQAEKIYLIDRAAQIMVQRGIRKGQE